jgi:SAM-dependent methyltransferase
MSNQPDIDAYWNTRTATAFAGGVRRTLKRVRWVNAVVSAVMSTRRGADTYLLSLVQTLGLSSVLDLACGEGKAALATECEAYGADIEGAPLEQAKLLGYKQTFTYCGPEYRIALDRQVDAVTAIAVNAHIPFDIFAAILREGIRHLSVGGYVIILAELDNRGASYELLRRVNRSGFTALVNAMGHFYLEHEDQLLAKLGDEFGELELHSRTAVVGSLVPYLQYRHALTGGDAETLAEHAFAFLFDAAAGLANRAQLAVSEARGSSFMVGLVFRKHDRRTDRQG